MNQIGAPRLLWGEGRFEFVKAATVVQGCRDGDLGEVVEVPEH
jgi:hypothetical protein